MVPDATQVVTPRSGAHSWQAQLYGVGDLLPNGIVPALPGISAWNVPPPSKLSDYIEVDSGAVKWSVAKNIHIQVSPEELKALINLADNQMFRMKFIDPKIPGYRITPEAFSAAQSALRLLHAMAINEGYERKPVKTIALAVGS